MSNTIELLKWCAGESGKKDYPKRANREVTLTHKQAVHLLKKLRELNELKT